MAFSETEIRYNRISDNANVASVLGLFSVRTESKAERKVRMENILSVFVAKNDGFKRKYWDYLGRSLTGSSKL